MRDDTAGPLTWSDELLLGDGAVDASHRALVEAIGQLQCAPDDALAEPLRQLVQELQEHFAEEEAQMGAHAYPAHACHADEHAAVLASGAGVLRALERGDAVPARRYADALAAWFPAHVGRLDAPLVQWLARRRFGGVPIVMKRGMTLQEPARQSIPSA